jgi:glucose/arabinose dehydrogenase
MSRIFWFLLSLALCFACIFALVSPGDPSARAQSGDPADATPVDGPAVDETMVGDLADHSPTDDGTGVELPPGYVFTIVTTDLIVPTSMAMLPNGDILVTEKGTGVGVDGRARVRRVSGGIIQEPPALSIGVNNTQDSGLMSIILDPNFATNRYLYLWYATGTHSHNWSGESVNRLSRFRYSPETGTIVPASETIILNTVPWSPIHNGGGMHFDSAGNLLLATGDGSPSPSGPAPRPQDLSSLNGKVLRIRPEGDGYTVPADNPFVGNSNARPEIFAYGLRNPFRLTHRQSDNNVFVADVGEYSWEEVNLLAPGANYGWAVREGPCPRGYTRQPCPPVPAQFTDPVLYYAHNYTTTRAAISALTFVETDAFPEEMRGRLLFADYTSRSLLSGRIEPDGFTIEPFAKSIGGIVDMKMTEDGLYLLDVVGGRILLIEHGGSGNQAPVANLTASPTLGRAPLNVAFSAAGSSDDDNFGLRYRWDFGDGSNPITTTRTTASHRYTTDGNYRATLTVIDRFGAESETVVVPITVYSGALPRIVLENLTDPGRDRYHGGDRIRYRVERTGGTQGLDPAEPYLWTVELIHNTHSHPDIVNSAASEGVYDIPTTAHDLNASIRYRFTLTMKTADGIEVEVTRDLEPHYTGLYIDAWPEPLLLNVNNAPVASGTNLAAIAGERYTLEAPLEKSYQNSVNEFAYWVVQDGWPASDLAHAEQPPQIWYTRTLQITVPVTDTAFVAHYTYARPLEQIFLPAIRN